jgi:phospholipid transport system substrate-binding protein
MTRRLLAIAGLLFAAAFLVQLAPSWAAQDPRAFVYGVGTQGLQVVGPSVPSAQRGAVFRQLFSANFDVPGIAQFALGLHWRSLDAQQQQEFIYLFGEFTAQAYAATLGQYSGARFTVGDALASNAGEVIVSSEIMRGGGVEILIKWYLVDRGGQYKIVDVVVDGVSQRLTERNEFASIIQRNSGRADTILAVLRQLLR